MSELGWTIFVVSVAVYAAVDIGEDIAKRWFPEPVHDTIRIDDCLDVPKSAHADMRHRAILHNTLGPYIAEKVFGTTITNSDGKVVSVRDICEDHILEDLGRIPAVSEYLDGTPMYDWLGGPKRVVRTINFERTGEDADPRRD